MERVAVDDLENSIQPAAVMRHLTEPLGLTDFALNYYELEPGDSFAFADHSHEIQEEVFFVIEGTATFDTESGAVEVGAGEAIRFGREEFQRGWNRGEERVVALALGAPLDYGEQVKLRYCSACAEETDNELARADDEEATVAYCKRCGTETGRWYRGSMPGEVP
ncbi:MAG: cupin domain-containing protein [Halolamina sp.]